MEVLLRWLIDDADAFTMPPLRYAQAASKNRLPPDQQPHPDQSLLEGDHNLASGPGGDLSHSKATDEKVHGACTACLLSHDAPYRDGQLN